MTIKYILLLLYLYNVLAIVSFCTFIESVNIF